MYTVFPLKEYQLNTIFFFFILFLCLFLFTVFNFFCFALSFSQSSLTNNFPDDEDAGYLFNRSLLISFHKIRIPVFVGLRANTSHSTYRMWLQRHIIYPLCYFNRTSSSPSCIKENYITHFSS